MQPDSCQHVYGIKIKSLNQTQNLVYIPTFSIWTRGVVGKYLQLQLRINHKRIEESVSYERRLGWIEEATSFKRTFRNLHFFKLLFLNGSGKQNISRGDISNA